MLGAPPAWQDEAGWQSKQTQRTRHVVMIATLAISSLCVTILLFGWFVKAQQQENDIADVSQDDVSVSEVVPPETDVSEHADLIEGKTGDQLPDAQEETVAEVATPALEPEDEMVAMGDPDAMAEDQAVAQTVIPDSLMPKSPIEDEVAAAEENETAMALQELPASLRQFTPFLLQEGPPENATLKAPPTIDQVEIDAAAEEDSSTLGIAPPEPIDLKKDLAVKLAFNSKGYPLPSLMLLLSQTTGVPIQMDWASFDLAGIDIGKRVAVGGKPMTSAKDWLEFIAQEVGGKVCPQEFLIIFTVSDQVYAASETDLLNSEDFGSEAASATKVIAEFMAQGIMADEVEGDAAVENEVDGEPRDGEALVNEVSEGDGKVGDQERPVGAGNFMEAREASQLKILATELLRRMRGITPKMDDQRASRWMQLKTGEVAEWSLLSGGKSGDQVDTPVTTAAMLRHTAAINESVCLVNWYDANRRGMRPTRLVMPRSDGNASEMMSRVLTPLSLQVRAVDAKHWWVGSGATYDRLPVLVQSEPLAEKREAYQRQLERIRGTAAPDVFRSVYDPVSDRMLMLVPRSCMTRFTKSGKHRRQLWGLVGNSVVPCCCRPVLAKGFARHRCTRTFLSAARGR